MYLKRIQLMGFKSFVDATSIPVLSHMNAIIGPNGCGKSNVVDAIRWVTGETSAKQLRGQSMSDVIFNGTSSRKPLGKAVVELTFDNTEGRITGEYAGFSEISIRREVVRDGQSSYYINGVSARRRDLIDLFLGTGLGPRSYAIIEQGMIAQLVEAKPEDLRSHFEEVAGVSKYRERRRETENRMRHTTENLDRLNDLREELNKQLRHLKRQSNSAQRYKQFKEEERLILAQLQVLQLQTYEAQLSDLNQQLSKLETMCEENASKQQSVETQIEKSRQASETLSDKKEAIQKEFYSLGAEIGRLEQAINHKQEQVKQWTTELEESNSLWNELLMRVEEHEQKLLQSRELKASFAPKTEAYQMAYEAISEELIQAETQWQETQDSLDGFRSQAANNSQLLEVARTDIAHYQRQLTELMAREQTLLADLNALSLDAHQDSLKPLQRELSELKLQKEEIEHVLEQVGADIHAQRDETQALSRALSESRGALQKSEAQHASLEAVQHSAIVDNQSELSPWLEKQGLQDAPRLGQKIGVKPGWELALEALLHDCFDAVCVDDINDFSGNVQSLEKGKLTLLEKTQANSSPSEQCQRVVDIVENIVYCPAHLAQIYVVETLNDALSLRQAIDSTESVITKDGIWVGKNWVRVSRESHAESGFLMREKTLKALSEEIEKQQQHLLKKEQMLRQAEGQLETLEAARESRHQQYQSISQSYTEVQSQLSRKEAEMTSLENQQVKINEELAVVNGKIDAHKTALLAAENKMAEYESRETDNEQTHALLQSQKEEAFARYNEIKQNAQEKKQSLDELSFQMSANNQQETLLTETIDSNKRQLEQLRMRRQNLVTQLKGAEEPIPAWRESLSAQLERRVSVEADLQEADQLLQNCQANLKTGESQRHELQVAMSSLQSDKQSIAMDKQAVLVRQITIQEQLAAQDHDAKAIESDMPEEANIPDWESQSQLLKQKIERLGPINLAAIDEYQSVNERKTYLDSQHLDLEEALNVLQTAIQKIDRETRSLFKETFDKVNAGFQRLFPRIFGGGQASLSLTDDNLLTTGIAVRAQPPGKRNSTIHMLSGGEKTLTAIALMFAMFELNPAPFCVLDEVDAPLDDLNVGRYCQLVKEMSASTQFLVISHNKVTIEMADHLMGVTMQEPGVSRIVSVDMQEAVALVDN